MFGFGKKKQTEDESLHNEVEDIQKGFMAEGEPLGSLLGGFTTSGNTVTRDKSMKTSAVFACVRLISSAVSSAPLIVYRRGEGVVRQPAPNHALARLLKLRPNRFMTASTFWKRIMSDKLLEGNAYAHIIRTGGGDPVALFPLTPSRTTVYWAWELGLHTKLGLERNRLIYDTTFEDGSRRVFDQDDILHIPNVGWNGKGGISTIRAMANAVGLSLAAEESAAGVFRKGMIADVALAYPSKLSDEAAQRLREHFERKYSGSGNHHTPLVLSEGGDVKTLNMSAEDAQLIESRKFSVIDICRFFGVNPVMIGESEKTSSWGSGVEQMGRWFNTLTLNEHFTTIEQELEVKCFGFDGHFAEFDESELTRGDTKTRGEFYKVARGSMQEPGFYTINEIRAAEGLPPMEGGDVLQRPESRAEDGGDDV